MLYYFTKGENTTEMQKKICAVYGEGAVTDQTCQKWSAKFSAGDFLLDDAPRLGRPVEVDSNQIKTLTESVARDGLSSVQLPVRGLCRGQSPQSWLGFCAQ